MNPLGFCIIKAERHIFVRHISALSKVVTIETGVRHISGLSIF